MNNLRRIIRLSLIPMMFILPLLLTVGRIALGVAGYAMFGDIFERAPILFVSLLIIGILITLRKDVKLSGKVGTIDAILMVILYSSVILYSFFAVDGGDTQDSLMSVASLLFGSGILNLSSILTDLLYWISFFVLIATFIVSLAELLIPQKKL